MATCPEPLPAPGVGLGLLPLLDEKTEIGNPIFLGAFALRRNRDCLARVASARDVLPSSPCRRRRLAGSCRLRAGQPRRGARCAAAPAVLPIWSEVEG